MVYVMLVAIILLGRIPVIGHVLKGLSTIVHELGHGFMTLLTSGRVSGIYLFRNNGGLIQAENKRGIPYILVLLAGYPTEAIFSFSLLVLYAKGKVDVLIITLAVVTVLALLLMRNLYGFIWVVGFGGFLYLLHQFQDQMWVHYALLVVVLVTLGESWYGACSIFIKSLRKRKEAGDASDLASYTWLPAVFWGLFFLVFALICAYYSLEWLNQLSFENPA